MIFLQDMMSCLIEQDALDKIHATDVDTGKIKR